METGYIKLWRALIQKPIWLLSTPEQRSVLIAVLLSANHKGHEWEWSGKKFEVDPGQFVTSLESLRKKSGAGISTQNVRSALRRFEKLEFLTNKATKSGRLISVINWESYQPKSEEGQQSTQQRGNKGATPNKNDKNERKEQTTMLEKEFAIFYGAYPKKKGKIQGKKTYLKLGRKKNGLPSLDLLLKAVALQKQSEDWKKEKGKYIPEPSSWLNAGRWEDEVKDTKPKRTYLPDNKPEGY